MKYIRTTHKGRWGAWKRKLWMCKVILTYRHVAIFALSDARKAKTAQVPAVAWQGFDGDRVLEIMKLHLEDIDRQHKVTKLQETLEEMKASGSQAIP